MDPSAMAMDLDLLGPKPSYQRSVQRLFIARTRRGRARGRERRRRPGPGGLAAGLLRGYDRQSRRLPRFPVVRYMRHGVVPNLGGAALEFVDARRPNGVVERLRRLVARRPGIWITPFPGDDIASVDGFQQYPSLSRLMGWPSDAVAQAYLDVDGKAVGAQQFPTVLKKYGLYVGKAYPHGNYPGTRNKCMFYRLPYRSDDDGYATPADQMAHAFSDVFPRDVLQYVRTGAVSRVSGDAAMQPAVVPTPAPVGRHRGCPTAVTVRIVDPETRKRYDGVPLTDDERYAMGALWQRARKQEKDGVTTLKIDCKHLCGALLRLKAGFGGCYAPAPRAYGPDLGHDATRAARGARLACSPSSRRARKLKTRAYGEFRSTRRPYWRCAPPATRPRSLRSGAAAARAARRDGRGEAEHVAGAVRIDPAEGRQARPGIAGTAGNHGAP